MTRIARGPLATAAVLAAAFSLAACTSAGSGAGSEESGGQSKSIKVWTEEDLPDRVAATQAIVDRFTAATGIAVELVPVSEDQFNQLLTTSAAADDLPDVGTVIVAVGGGGLSSGVAAAVKLRCPHVRVLAIEPAGARKLSAARAAGGPVTLAGSSGLPDGLLGVRIGTSNFAHLERYCDEVVQVDDASIRCAMRFLIDRMKLVAEPSGAITLAALLDGIVTPTGPTVAVLSGGNIEWAGLMPLVADPVTPAAPPS